MISKFRIRAAFAVLLATSPALAQSAPAPSPTKTPTSAGRSHSYSLSGDYWGTHDPSIIKAGNTWYVFATGKAPDGGQMAIRCSEDLQKWALCGHVVDRIPEWIHKESPGTAELWAPDISFYKGAYRLYYAYSLFGKNTSGIALATNKTLDPKSPDYKWMDQGLVLRSTAEDNYNAIDPNFIVDTHGKTWLAFGSFWSGIKLVKLVADTWKPPAGPLQVIALAARKQLAKPPPVKPGLPPDWEAVEAPFLVHHGQFYYLFVSWDLCCRGTRSTYRTMVGRAREVTGPYLDKSRVDMKDGGGSPVLSANSRWLGPGGESVLMGSKEDIIVFHVYDAKTGDKAMQISTIDWSSGWPQIALQQ